MDLVDCVGNTFEDHIWGQYPFVLLLSEVPSLLTCSHFLLWVWTARISVASCLLPALPSWLDLTFSDST